MSAAAICCRPRRLLRHVSRPDRKPHRAMAMRCGRVWPPTPSRPSIPGRACSTALARPATRVRSCARFFSPAPRETDDAALHSIARHFALASLQRHFDSLERAAAADEFAANTLADHAAPLAHQPHRRLPRRSRPARRCRWTNACGWSSASSTACWPATISTRASAPRSSTRARRRTGGRRRSRRSTLKIIDALFRAARRRETSCL